MSERYILGAVISDHDSSVCLLKDGKLVACINEERLCRVKRGDPRNSIRRAIHYVLNTAQIPIERVDMIITDCDHYYPPGGHPPIDVFPDFSRKDDIVQLNHHVGHVASAFFPSPFLRAAVLTVDASGGIAPVVPDKNHWGLLEHEIAFRKRGMITAHDNPTLENLLKEKPTGEARNYPAESLTLNYCELGKPIKELENYFAQSSLGYFYALCSHFLDMEEGSFMGLSSHGKRTKYYDAMCEVIRLLPDGQILIDPDWMLFWEGNHVLEDPVALHRLTKKFNDTFGQPRKFSDEITKRDKDFAWAGQKRTEDALVHVAKHLFDITGCENICVAGGVGLNSVANLVILDDTPFRNIFIQPAASDDGIALGNALFGHYVLANLPDKPFFDIGNACLGRDYPEPEIQHFIETLEQGRLKIDYLPSLPFIEKVDLLFRTDPDGEFERREMGRNPNQDLFEIEIDVQGANEVEYEFEVLAASPETYLYEPPVQPPGPVDVSKESDIGSPDGRFVACDVSVEDKAKADNNQDPFEKFLSDHQDIAGVLDGERAFTGPEHVVIDPTNHCDNNCIGCWTRSPLLGSLGAPQSWKSQQMESERLVGLIDELADIGTRRVRFTGGGEPFVHPAIMDALRKVKDRNLISAVTTNFSALSEKRTVELAELGIDEITVSLWAGTPEVYARSHPNKSWKTFEQIEGHLKLLCSKKPKKSKVILANVIFSMNFMETREMLDFALRVGADGIYFTVIDSVNLRTDGLLLTPPHIEILQDHILQVRDKVDRINAQGRSFLLDNFHGFVRRIKSIGVTSGDYDKIAVDKIPCYIGWIFCRILPNGDVSPCCRGVDIPMGNIADKGFVEVWDSPKYREFRKMALTKPKSHPYFKDVACYRTCDNLMHNEQVHERVTALTDEEKQHLVEFVVNKR